MKLQKILSVSIAAYNVEEYIEETLLSCLVRKDLREKIEVLIVNDGSTDSTLEIIKRYEKKYPELYRVIDKENGGYGSTINASLKLAQGKYFRILDGDDWINTECLEKFLAEADNFEEDVIFSDLKHVYVNNGKVIKTRHVKYTGVQERGINFLKEDVIIKASMHSMTVATKLLIDNDVQLAEKCFYTDGEYVFYVLAYMNTYRYFNGILYEYRLGRVGQSVSYRGRIKHKDDYYRVLKRELEFNKESHFVKKTNYKNLQTHIVDTATGVLQYNLLCPYSKENVENVKRIDEEIRNDYPEIFSYMNRKKSIWVLRKFNYRSYRLCRWNELRKMILMNNM